MFKKILKTSYLVHSPLGLLTVTLISSMIFFWTTKLSDRYIDLISLICEIYWNNRRKFGVNRSHEASYIGVGNRLSSPVTLNSRISRNSSHSDESHRRNERYSSKNKRIYHVFTDWSENSDLFALKNYRTLEYMLNSYSLSSVST